MAPLIDELYKVGGVQNLTGAWCEATTRSPTIEPTVELAYSATSQLGIR